MSLPAPYIESYYVADGVTTSFAFGQGFTALSDVNVKCIIYFDDQTSCVPTFTVNMTTGYITIVTLTKPNGTVLTAPPAGSIVRVFRDTPEQQNATASQLQNYTAKQLEKIFDSIVAMIQENTFTTEHKTLRLTETQRDVFLAFLKEANDDALLYWDNEARTVVPTDFVHQDIVRMSGGLFFRMKHDAKLRPYLEWSINGQTDWHSLNWWNASDSAEEAKDIAEEAKQIAQDAKDISDDAKEISEDANEKSDNAKEIAEEALDAVNRITTQELTFYIEAGQRVIETGVDLTNKNVDLYWNGQLISKAGNWTISGENINLLFEPEEDAVIVVMIGTIRQAVNVVSLEIHNIDLDSHANLMASHNADLNAHANLVEQILASNIDCGTL